MRGQWQGWIDPHECFNLKKRRRKRTVSVTVDFKEATATTYLPRAGGTHSNEGLTVTGVEAPIF